MRSRVRAALLGFTLSLTGVVATPAAAFDNPTNSAPGDTRVVSEDSFGEVGRIVETFDVDNDGDDDLIVGNPNFGGGDGALFAIYLAPDAGAFTDAAIYTDDSFTLPGAPGPDITINLPLGFGRQFDAGDFDGDGVIDLAFGSDFEIFVADYPGPGVFEQFELTSSLSLTGVTGSSVAVDDFDGDGLDDLAIGQAEINIVQIHTGPLTFVPDITITGNGGSSFGHALDSGDVIAGGSTNPALVVGAPFDSLGSFSNEGVVYLFDDPLQSGADLDLTDATSFYLGDDNEVLFGTDVLVADVSGSSALDVVGGAPGFTGDGFVAVAEGPLSAGSFTSAQALGPWAPVANAGIGRSLAAGDVDNDGQIDLAAGGNDIVVARSHDEASEWVFNGTAGSDFGADVAIVGNQYMAVGAPTTDHFSIAGTPAGAVEVFVTGAGSVSPGGPFVVDNVGNDPDVTPGDGFCSTSDNVCTLLAAIQEVNANGGSVIDFGVPGAGPHVINVTTPLPPITSPVTIDGLSQPGSSDAFTTGGIQIGLRSSLSGPADDGLTLANGSDGSSIAGLAISGFSGSAIRVESADSTVEQNRLGIRTADLAGAPPNQIGLTVAPGASNTTVDRNLVSNNSNGGIDNLGLDSTISRNRIGTSVDGTAPRPNGLGINTTEDVTIFGNIVSGNDGVGIQIKAGNVDIFRNRIGVSATANQLGNNGPGILANDDSGGTITGRLGSTETTDGNEIAFNSGEGIALAAGVRIAVLGNSIGNNQGLGIDLGVDGVTANDTGDADSGINDLLNFPDLTSATITGGTDVQVQASLDVPAGDFRVEYFASTSCDPSGFGEGVSLTQTASYSSTGGPIALSDVIPLAAFGGATNLTATATLYEGGQPATTSEFSACVSVLAGSTATVDSLSLSVDQATTGPGITSIAISDIPVEAVLAASSTVEGAPLGAVPLGAVPLGAVDLSASPLGAVPLGAVPLGAVPLGAVPLGAVPLGAVPVEADGGWSALLDDTPFEGQLPQAVTLDQIIALIESDTLPSGHPLRSLPLGAVDLSATPLGAVSTAGLVLGATDLRSDASLAQLCVEAARQGIPCDDTRNTLIALELSGYDVAAAPLGAVPLGAVPLGAVPLGAVPLGAVPLGAVPLGAVPLGAVPLGAVPLGAVPLGAVSVAGTPLGAVPLGAVPLGAVPLGAVPLGAVSLDGNVGCAILAGTALDCPALGLDDASTFDDVIAALEANGSSLAASPLGAVPLGAVPLGAVPLGAVPLGAVDFDVLPLGAVPLGAVDLAGTPLGAVPLGAVSTDAGAGCALLVGFEIGLDVADCAALGLSDASTLFDAAVLLERAGSSLAASPLGAVPLGAVPLGAVEIADDADITTLADLFGESATLADLPAEVLEQLSLADILLALVIASDYPWETIDLVEIGVQDFAPDATVVTYQATIDITGDGQIVVSATLPAAYRYRAGTSTFLGAPALDPIVSDGSAGQTLTWYLDVVAGTAQNLEFAVSPGFTLGSHTVDGAATGAGPTVAAPNAAPHTIVPGAEPTSVVADTLRLGYLTATSEVDTYTITTPGAGFTTSVFLSHLSQDSDLVLYRPTTAPPPGGTASTAPAPTTSIIEDDGFSQILGGRTEAESLGDVPFDPFRSVVESSAGRDPGAETVSDETDVATTYSIEVSGYNGATSDEPYVLRTRFEAEAPIAACPPQAFGPTPDLASGTLPADLETLVVFDQGRTETVHGAAGAAQARASAEQLVAFLNDPINGFGSAAILFTDDLTDYAAWDSNPCDWRAADAIAKDVRTAIIDYAEANESLRYVTILGDDTVIPFHRQPDATAYANETSFASEFGEDQGGLYGSLAAGNILTDHPYGDPDPIPWLDRFLYLPEIAVGRLLESPAEMATAIDTFVTFGGDLDPASTALVTGYDFLTDGATQTEANLAGNGLTTTSIISETWDDDDLQDAIFGTATAQPSIVSANAHFDYYRALPAAEQLADEATFSDATLFQVSDVEGFLAGGGQLDRTWLFTMGCHAGLSVSDVSLGASPTLDWAQLYGGNGGIFTGNTGYGYGDTVTVALTEELVVGVAGALDGSLTLGQSVVSSLQNYYGRAGLYGVYDEKALQQFTTYGLPMYRVPGTGSGPAPVTPPTVTIDSFTGQPSATLVTDITPTANMSSKGTYYDVDGQTLDIHYRPIQPMTSIDVTVPGLVARGAIITDWSSVDLTVLDAAYSRPVIDDGDREAEISDDSVVFPSTFAAIANFEQPSTQPGQRTEERQNLNLIVGQYDAPNNIQRLFSDIETEVFYLPADSPLANDTTPLVIERVQATVLDDSVGFIVDLDDDAAAAKVVVLYRPDGSSQWQRADLVSGSPWSGGGPVPSGTTEVEYFVQAVKPSGLVSVSSSKGVFHRATPEPTVDNTPELTVDLAGTSLGAWYTSTVDVDVSGQGGPFEVTLDGSPVGNSFSIVDDGVHIVDVIDAAGMLSRFVVPIDKTSPEIGISLPATIEQGDELVLAYECRDAGSGVASCSGPAEPGTLLDTSTPGAYSVTVTAVDEAGNPATSVTAAYVVQGLVEAAIDLTVAPSVAPVGETVTASVTALEGTVTETIIDWGDGSTNNALTHQYTEPGIYTVEASTTMADGQTATATVDEVVAYDNSGHRVLGAGVFTSTQGSVTADPDHQSLASIAFNVRYRSTAATEPTGSLHLNVTRGGPRYRATSWDWLVVENESMALAAGTARLRGSNEIFRFELAVEDGRHLFNRHHHRHDGSDTLQLQIWNDATGELVYDSGEVEVTGVVAVLDPPRPWGHWGNWGNWGATVR